MSLLWGSQSAAFSVAIGGAVGILSFDLLRRIIGKVFGDPALLGSYYFLFVLLKFMALVLVIWILLRQSFVRPLGLIVGLSAVPIGAFLEGALSAVGLVGRDTTPMQSDAPRYYAESKPDGKDRERMLR